MVEFTERHRRRFVRGRQRPAPRRRAALEVQSLECRALLTVTPLVWASGVSLPAARGGAAAVELSGAVVVAGGNTTG